MTWTSSSPTSSSPNGDGINDVFTALGTPGDLACFTLRIYHRWASSSSREVEPEHRGWKKPERGAVPDGVYYYVAEVGARVQRGTVHVLR
ncbi:MAG: gliding motility-associated C-terminal domain-containing protein [Flavobacteriales bacterium]